MLHLWSYSGHPTIIIILWSSFIHPVPRDVLVYVEEKQPSYKNWGKVLKVSEAEMICDVSIQKSANVLYAMLWNIMEG